MPAFVFDYAVDGLLCVKCVMSCLFVMMRCVSAPVSLLTFHDHHDDGMAWHLLQATNLLLVASSCDNGCKCLYQIHTHKDIQKTHKLLAKIKASLPPIVRAIPSQQNQKHASSQIAWMIISRLVRRRLGLEPGESLPRSSRLLLSRPPPSHETTLLSSSWLWIVRRGGAR